VSKTISSDTCPRPTTGGVNIIDDCATGRCTAPTNCLNYNAVASSPYSHKFVDITKVNSDSKNRPGCEAGLRGPGGQGCFGTPWASSDLLPHDSKSAVRRQPTIFTVVLSSLTP
jgi:hypothetical protein